MCVRSRAGVRIVACVGAAALLLTSACGGSTNPVTPGGGGTTGGGTTGGATAVTASIGVQNTPCVAPATGAVSCTFAGTASGATGPYSFSWRFTSPTGSVVTATTQNVQPALECGFAPGVATFQLGVSLTATPAAGTATIVTSTQQVARAAGTCGT